MVWLHLCGVAVAAVSGLVILVRPKCTRWHRRWGAVYGAAMVATMFSSFGIAGEGGGASIFHAVSVLTLVVLLAGLAQPRFRRGRPTWVRWHAGLMQLSYLMLVITGVSQFFDRLPLPSDALNAIVFLQLPLFVGFALIGRSVRPAGLERFAR